MLDSSSVDSRLDGIGEGGRLVLEGSLLGTVHEPAGSVFGVISHNNVRPGSPDAG